MSGTQIKNGRREPRMLSHKLQYGASDRDPVGDTKIGKRVTKWSFAALMVTAMLQV